MNGDLGLHTARVLQCPEALKPIPSMAIASFCRILHLCSFHTRGFQNKGDFLFSAQIGGIMDRPGDSSSVFSVQT